MGRYVKIYFYLCLLVAGAGLEPASALAQSILSRSSLPISPTCHIFILTHFFLNLTPKYTIEFSIPKILNLNYFYVLEYKISNVTNIILR